MKTMEANDEKKLATETTVLPKQRGLALLAGAVALLAVSFVVVVAVTAWSLNTNCQNTPANAPHKTETFEVDASYDDTVRRETVVVDEQSQKDYFVARNSDGLIETVATVDYSQNQTTLYSAKGNICLVATYNLGSFEETLSGLRNPQAKDAKYESFTVVGLLGDHADIPVEMTPYCTRSNTYLIDTSSQGERTKRKAKCSCSIGNAGIPNCCEVTKACPWFNHVCWHVAYFGYVPVYYCMCWSSVVMNDAEPCAGFYCSYNYIGYLK